MGDFTKVVQRMQVVANTRDHPAPRAITLTAAEVHAVLEHIRWLRAQREHLLSGD